MIDPDVIAKRQFELTAEFGKWVFDHAEADNLLPDGAYVFFEVAGDVEFNSHSQCLAEQHRQQGDPVARVRVKGLSPAQGSRLIDPVIEPLAEVA